MGEPAKPCGIHRRARSLGQAPFPAGLQLGREQLLQKDARPAFQDKERKPLGEGHAGQASLLLGDRKTREDALCALGRARRALPPSCYLETVLPDGYARTHPHRTQGTKGRRRAQGAEGAPAPRPWTGWDNTERPSSPQAGRPPELVKATKPQCQETQKRPGRINTPQWPQ